MSWHERSLWKTWNRTKRDIARWRVCLGYFASEHAKLGCQEAIPGKGLASHWTWTRHWQRTEWRSLQSWRSWGNDIHVEFQKQPNVSKQAMASNGFVLFCSPKCGCFTKHISPYHHMFVVWMFQIQHPASIAGSRLHRRCPRRMRPKSSCACPLIRITTSRWSTCISTTTWPRLTEKNTPGWWFGTWLDYDFPYIGNFITPTDELIFFRGVGIPPDTDEAKKGAVEKLVYKGLSSRGFHFDRGKLLSKCHTRP